MIQQCRQATRLAFRLHWHETHKSPISNRTFWRRVPTYAQLGATALYHGLPDEDLREARAVGVSMFDRPTFRDWQEVHPGTRRPGPNAYGRSAWLHEATGAVVTLFLDSRQREIAVECGALRHVIWTKGPAYGWVDAFARALKTMGGAPKSGAWRRMFGPTWKLARKGCAHA